METFFVPMSPPRDVTRGGGGFGSSHTCDVAGLFHQPLLALDYSRIAATVLWAQCKHQQAQLEALTARIEALEAPKKKTVKSK